MENWDFDCPQFVDFAAALDSPSNEVFHDTSTNDVPATDVNESCRYDLGPKMATPKVKPSDPSSNNYPFVNAATDDEKIAFLPPLTSRLSKSDGCLHEIIKCLKTPGDKGDVKLSKKQRRTSFSVNFIKKRRVYATTPNCLKRTMVNSKIRNAKTSEELELQKIAELQNMLHKHIALNKINLQRLKMNKAPFTLETLKRATDSKIPSVKCNATAPSKSAPKSTRNFHNQNYIACGAPAAFKKINVPHENLKTKDKPSVNTKKPHSNVLRDLNVLKKGCDNVVKNQPMFEKYNAHGGLKFIPHQEKTKQFPFSFDSSYASLGSASPRAANKSKIHASLSVSKNTPFVLENKENLMNIRKIHSES